MTHKVVDLMKFSDRPVKVGSYNECLTYVANCGYSGFSIQPLNTIEKDQYQFDRNDETETNDWAAAWSEDL